MTAAISYHLEAYTTTDPKLMDRNAAGKSFLRGQAREFWAQVQKREHAQHCAERMQTLDRRAKPSCSAASRG